MKIFALETDLNVTKAQYLKPNEQEVLFVRPHVISFLLRSSIYFLATAVIIALAVYIGVQQLVAPGIAAIGGLFLWFGFVFFGLLRTYIDWRYDFLMLTEDTLIMADQSSLFSKSIRPISLDSIVSVEAVTQWLHLFGFGIVKVALDQGKTHPITLRFMPNAEDIVATISSQVAAFRERRE